MNALIASILAILPLCAPDVHQYTMLALIQAESGFNQYAIAVVDEYPSFVQPHNFDEAKALIDTLEAQNKNYSVGLAQISSSNFARFNTTGLELLDPCLNLKAAQAILKECYIRSGNNVNDALSCYYSGNLTRGYRLEQNNQSYVGTVHQNAQNPLIPSLQNHPYSDNLTTTQRSNLLLTLKGSSKIESRSGITIPNTPIKDFTLIQEKN